MANEEGDERADQADRTLGVEHMQPGQNSFAMATVQRHRYMIQANAFYQQEWSAREGTPPSQIHPACRQPDLISNLARPIPRWSPQPTQHQHTPTPAPRDSAVTTMSSLERAAKRANSPEELNLGTTPVHTPRPTPRAIIEDQAEYRQHQASGTTDNRTPVYHPTPKDANEGFDPANRAKAKKPMPVSDSEPIKPPPRGYTEPILDRERSVKFSDSADHAPQKTPKKSGMAALGDSFRDIFRPASSRRSNVDAASRPPTPAPGGTPTTTRMPPKAAQVLGSSDDSKGLGRSPSKKSIFSRRASDIHEAKSSPKKGKKKGGEDSNEPPPRSNTSMGFRVDAGSESTRSRTTTTPSTMQSGSESGSATQRLNMATPAMGLTRHSSLKYNDGQMPPTPPSKDTPPDEKIIRHMNKQVSPLTSFTDTPTRGAGFISSSSRVSPSRDGSYGQRHVPKLVTAPSMHSMRASVAIDAQAHNPAQLQELNDRIGGLGLEGFNMPGEYEQSTIFGYSPSVYSQEWTDPRNSVVDVPDRVSEVEEEEVTPTRPTPQDQMQMRPTRSPSVGTPDTSVTSATVDLIYPELHNDPSIAAFQTYEQTPPQASNTPAMATAFEQLEDVLESTAGVGTSRVQDNRAPETPQSRHQQSRTERRRATLAPSALQNSGGEGHEVQTTKSQSFDQESDSSKSSFEFDENDMEAAIRHRNEKLARTGLIHPAFRKPVQEEAETSPMSNHPSAKVSPLKYVQHTGTGQILSSAAYDPNAPGKSTGLKAEFTPLAKQDEGVAKMRRALAAEDMSPAPKRRPGNIMDSRPNLAPSNAAAAPKTGVRSPRRAKRFPRSTDVDPAMSTTSSESRSRSPSRESSPSQQSRAVQPASSRANQQQTSLGNQQPTSRAAKTSLANDDNVSRFTCSRDADMRAFNQDAQRFKASIERKYPSTTKALTDDSAADSGVDIDNHKNTTGPHRPDTRKPKRVSTANARKYYLGPPAGGDTPDSSRCGTPNTTATNDSEASTIVLTPNLPYGFRPPPGGAPVTSSQLAGYETHPTVSDMSSPTPAEPRGKGKQKSNNSTATGSGGASGGKTTSRSTTSTTPGSMATPGNNTSSTRSSGRARVVSNASTAHTSSSDTLPGTATSRKTSTNVASNTIPAPSASGSTSSTAPSNTQAVPYFNQPAATPPAVAPTASPPVAIGAPSPPPTQPLPQPSPALQMQAFMALYQQQAEAMRLLSAQMNRLEMTQLANQQGNQQASPQTNAPISQQGTQQPNQAAQQMPQVAQQASQNNHQTAQAPQAPPQADDTSSDEDDRADWFNPG
ncbi:hypothetical protein M409DRAFT_24945 [Zasmidium cellare ATCC 36951]|uniref:Uncharacterized protein n=1 Tax=Zasmidium cellare ATCC 36951 TaxID=1080233 RepID=A0A6A6CBW0_ZASCE|nr:uncharacterized protein M409DRAFT_24945 [Zasmidium cellare ATCC 36951]KAF2164545.1 hypothetical protein M409DRAFT_24945 [Zasmidium cellare ATCC 36951]